MRKKDNFFKLMAIMLAVLLFFSFAENAFAALWDGYGSSGEQNNRLVIADMNKIADILSSGLGATSKIKGDSNYTGAWLDMVNNTAIRFKGAPKDYTNYDTLKMNIYSTKATGNQFALCIYAGTLSKEQKTANSIYFLNKLIIDWEGWKTFEIPFESMTAYNAPDRANVTEFYFTSTGWSSTPNPEAQLYFDSIYAVSSENSTTGVGSPMYTNAEKKQFDKSEASKAILLYPFSKNIYHNGEISTYDSTNSSAKLVYYDGVEMVPISFLRDVLGAELIDNNGSFEIKKGNISIHIVNGEKTYSVNGADKEFETYVREYNGVVFVPAVACAKELGFCAQSFDGLVAIGNEKTVKAYEGNELFQKIAMLNVTDTFDVSNVSSEEFSKLKKKIKESYVGSEDIDTNNPYIQKMIQAVDNKGVSAWKTMNKGKNISILFGTKSPTSTEEMRKQYEKLLEMATAWGMKGTSVYNNKELKKDILSGLNWCYCNLYGLKEIDGVGWKSIWDYNWWDWCIGVPQALIPTVAILYDELDRDLVNEYLFIPTEMNRLKRNLKIQGQASGRINILTPIAILTEDRELLKKSYDDYWIINDPRNDKTSDEGAYVEDGMYLAHGQAYTMGYGVARLQRVADAGKFTANSAIELMTPFDYGIQKNALLYTYRPAMFNGRGMSMLLHRQVKTSSEIASASAILASYCDVLGTFGEEMDGEIRKFIKTHISEEILDYSSSRVTPSQLEELVNIYNDSTISTYDDYQTGDVSWLTDTLIQQRNDYAFGISMFSSRIGDYESINGTNMDGWYQNAGSIYMYTKYDNEQYGTSWWQNSDKYMIPGTTVDTQERPKVSVALATTWKNSQDFVGGVEFNDDYLVGTMNYEAFHNDTEGAAVQYGEGTASGSGGGLPIHKSTLTANKSYFLFDDELVALGNSIKSDDGYPVRTIVDNRRLKTNDLQEQDLSDLREYKIVNVTATGNDGNVESNVLDNDLSTRWSMEGTNGVELVLELEEVKTIGYVGISYYNTKKQSSLFEIQVSEDGKSWTNVGSYKSVAQSQMMDPYDMKNVKAKYIKYIGKGREGSLWNSITEFKAYPPSIDGTMPTAFSDEISVMTGIYGTEDVVLNGELQPKTAFEKTVDDAKWVYVEGAGGYVFQGATNLSLEKTNKEEGYIKLWINHGENPSNGSYAYIMLPNKTKEEVSSYYQNPDVEIRSNTNDVQCVFEKNLNIKGIVFRAGAKQDEIAVSAPCVLMAQEKDGIYTLTVSDPTWKLDSLTITIDKDLKVNEADSKMTIHSENDTVIELDLSEHTGRTYKAIFNVN